MKKRIGIALAVIAVVLLSGYLGLSYIVYDQLSRITPGGGVNASNVPSSFAMTYPEWASFDEKPYFMPDYEDVRIPSRQKGITLAAWYVPGRPDAPAIIVTHGISGCKCDPNVLTVAGMLHRNGFNVLLYDMRNHGQSDIDNGRTAVGNKEYQDTLGAWDWLITVKEFPPNRIGLYAESLGAATTLIAFSQEPRLAAAWVDSPFSNLKQVMDEELARNHYPTILADGSILVAKIVSGEDLLAHNPSDAILKDAGRPIFIVHGTGDKRIGVHHTQELAGLAAEYGANVTVWMPEGVPHVGAEFDFPKEYEERMIAFFTAALSH